MYDIENVTLRDSMHLEVSTTLALDSVQRNADIFVITSSQEIGLNFRGIQKRGQGNSWTYEEYTV